MEFCISASTDKVVSIWVPCDRSACLLMCIDPQQWSCWLADIPFENYSTLGTACHFVTNLWRPFNLPDRVDTLQRCESLSKGDAARSPLERCRCIENSRHAILAA